MFFRLLISRSSLIKVHYCREILALTPPENVGLIKKQKFIDLYDSAKRYVLILRKIQAGWRGAGLVPFNPQKVFASRQVQRFQLLPNRCCPESSPRSAKEEEQLLEQAQLQTQEPVNDNYKQKRLKR